MAVDPTALIVLIVYMAGVVALGVWIGRKQASASDYMLGGRDLPWWALLLSIVATETSTVSFLSVPGLVFSIQTNPGNLTFLQLPIGYIVGRTLVVLLLLPLYFRGSFYTAYEVLHHRFGGATRKVASLMFMVTRTLADGGRLYLSAIVLSLLLDIHLTWAVLALGIATIVYTFLGGMKAVVWTDVVQFVVYMAGAVLAFEVILEQLPGGFEELWSVARADDKLTVFDFRLVFDSVYVFWAGLLGGAFLTFGTHGVDQLIVQRLLCARSQRQAGMALWLSGPVVLLQFAVFLGIGVGLYVFYKANPPVEAFTESDQVFATFIVNNLSPVAMGIVLGAVFSAAMSTLSSSLNSSATAAVNDVWLPLTGRTAEDPGALGRARLMTIVFGALQILVGVTGLGDRAVVNSVLAIASFTTGILLGLFFLGAFTTSVRQREALIGLVGGLLVMSFLQFGLPWLFPGVRLAWPWFAAIGPLVTFGLGMLAHTLWGRRPPTAATAP